MKCTSLWMTTWMTSALIAALLGPVPVLAEEASFIKLIEVDDADCAVNDGKLITLTNTEPQSGKVVWVDRWYMDKQTADHTRHVLDREHPSAALGCSITRAGKQHWTIYSVTDLPG
jgi:hypothetical protein